MTSSPNTTQTPQRVLITGGTGVIGLGTIPQLLAEGYRVRLLSRSATESAGEWPAGVELRDGDVTDPASLTGACDNCHAVIHVTGIVDEQPGITFESVNVNGTRHILEAARHAGVQRFLLISSLGADRGQSPYHQSKRAAEALVQQFPRDWVILRPGHVFGPGDEMISMVLKMLRASPIIPEVGVGQHRFQPLWYKDCGSAITHSLIQTAATGKILEIAGQEVVTVRELIQLLSRLTDRPGLAFPIPAFVLKPVLKLIELLKRTFRWRARLPMNESKLLMLLEENIVPPGQPNALIKTLGLTPTPLHHALAELVDALPENPPETGVGQLTTKRFTTRLKLNQTSAVDLITLFRIRIQDIMPIDFRAEPGAPEQIEYARTLSAHLPGRGHIQVRVVECEPERITFATVEGHPLSGIVTFSARMNQPA